MNVKRNKRICLQNIDKTYFSSFISSTKVVVPFFRNYIQQRRAIDANFIKKKLPDLINSHKNRY